MVHCFELVPGFARSKHTLIAHVIKENYCADQKAMALRQNYKYLENREVFREVFRGIHDLHVVPNMSQHLQGQKQGHPNFL
jgi:hypothetical protein